MPCAQNSCAYVYIHICVVNIYAHRNVNKYIYIYIYVKTFYLSTYFVHMGAWRIGSHLWEPILRVRCGSRFWPCMASVLKKGIGS